MTTSGDYTLISNVITNAQAIQTMLNNATYQASVDNASAQTWFGIPDSIAQDLRTINDMFSIIQDKLALVLDAYPNTTTITTTYDLL